MKIYEVAVLGGGFSGLVSAIILSDFFGGENVLVLEKNDRVGKKILATGNGRGNVTNSSISAENYHSSGAMADVANTLEKYSNKSIIAFFRSLGVPVTSDGDRIYPASLQANSLLDSMRAKLGYLKTDIGVNAECQKIEGGRGRYVIRTMEGEYAAKRVIFATGGKAGKQYGTDGSAFEILKKHGVKITPLSPAIVQLKTETEWIKGLKGLKEKAFVTAYDGEKPIKNFFGDVLFTDYGVSGNAAFYLSSYLVGAKNPQISISFTGMEQAELADFLKQKIASLPYVTVDDVLSGVINKQIGKAIVKRSGVKTADERSMEKIARIAKDFRLKVVGTLGFDYAQVTRGGVAAEELGDGFELKKLPGVYVAGEATDIDGDCGGYNLQWAYSSARAACDKIIAAAQ